MVNPPTRFFCCFAKDSFLLREIPRPPGYSQRVTRSFSPWTPSPFLQRPSAFPSIILSSHLYLFSDIPTPTKRRIKNPRTTPTHAVGLGWGHRLTHLTYSLRIFFSPQASHWEDFPTWPRVSSQPPTAQLKPVSAVPIPHGCVAQVWEFTYQIQSCQGAIWIGSRRSGVLSLCCIRTKCWWALMSFRVLN